MNPIHPPTATPYRVRVLFADTDAMGVVYHGRFFPWFEAGRGEYLRARGYTYREMEAAGVGLAVLEVQCRFRAAARYDDLLLLYTWLAEFSPHPCAISVRLISGSGSTLISRSGNTAHFYRYHRATVAHYALPRSVDPTPNYNRHTTNRGSRTIGLNPADGTPSDRQPNTTFPNNAS